MPRRLLLAAVLAATAVAWAGTATSASAGTPPEWIARIQAVVGDRPVSVAIGNDGDYWYRNLAWVRRAPASNEKLLLSMALFERYGLGGVIRTSAMATQRVDDGVLDGDLWLVGRGDPELGAADLGRLADALVDAGVRRITGAVLGATGPFARDWWATGWKEYFPVWYVALPTALAYERNEDAEGHHITDPERRAAKALTQRLEARGVRVRGIPDADTPPAGLRRLAAIDSAPLEGVIRRMNVWSRNFWAEVLGKRLGADTLGEGTIANGATATCRFASAHGESFTCYDGSGLSYANRASALGILHLLWYADTQPWAEALRATLPTGGQGTLEDRLPNVRLRAKTGTLDDVSALSGWVWLETTGEWAEFSILSSGYSEGAAKEIEEAIVRVISAEASDPDPTD
jgi:D-alanyl-D-alanine carboxypeptidase/D-alanyl-D-alanine-endopeptidase (penicillin-binding protein 4)